MQPPPFHQFWDFCFIGIWSRLAAKRKISVRTVLGKGTSNSYDAALEQRVLIDYGTRQTQLRKATRVWKFPCGWLSAANCSKTSMFIYFCRREIRCEKMYSFCTMCTDTVFVDIYMYIYYIYIIIINTCLYNKTAHLIHSAPERAVQKRGSYYVQAIKTAMRHLQISTNSGLERWQQPLLRS